MLTLGPSVRAKKNKTVKPPRETAAPAPPASYRDAAGWAPPVLLMLAILIFYWTPLTSPNASIQWDAVDVHYSSQKYFADSMARGELPHWTPYIFSGFPFLADPQVGAWYPLNWPFFLLGVTPRAIQFEIFLHALLACFGAWLLARRMLQDESAALAAALGYGLSGFFAAHASHVGMLQTAAWLPWLLLVFHKGSEAAGRAYIPLAGLAAGSMLLAGHFQTSLYALSAVAIIAAIEAVRSPAKRSSLVLCFAAAALIAAGLAAVQLLPSVELAGHSIRAGLDTSASSEGVLTWASMPTLLLPDSLGALSGNYRGPADITQFYFYGGFLLLPLAALGLRNRALWPVAFGLVAMPFWYALGPSFGLARLLGILPGFGQIRAPVHCWFVIALGLALLAGAGVQVLGRKVNSRLGRKFNSRYVAYILTAVFLMDLAYWNSSSNPMAYARANFEQAYAPAAKMLQESVKPLLDPQTRLHAADHVAAFGSLNHPLDEKIETTYGYNPLALSRYRRYLDAAAAHPALLKGLSVSRVVNIEPDRLDAVAGTLPLATFPAKIVSVAGPSESAAALRTLDPLTTAIVENAPAALAADPLAEVLEVSSGPRSYTIRYKSAAGGLLRLAVPYFPGWEATIKAGAACPLFPVDHALMGVAVPAGEHEVVVAFHSRFFLTGMLISLATLLGACFAAVWLHRPGSPLEPPVARGSARPAAFRPAAPQR